jgi:hypothetical protein
MERPWNELVMEYKLGFNNDQQRFKAIYIAQLHKLLFRVLH